MKRIDLDGLADYRSRCDRPTCPECTSGEGHEEHVYLGAWIDGDGRLHVWADDASTAVSRDAAQKLVDFISWWLRTCPWRRRGSRV